MRKSSPVWLLAGLLAWPAGAAEPTEATPPPPAVSDPVLVAEEGAPEVAPGPRFTVGTEYLFWWLREGRMPATLTTSSQASRGRIGQPDTRTLYGDDRLETRHGDQFNGVRFTLGYWLDDAQTLGVEGKAFFLERDSTHFKAVSDGTTLLALPYTNPDGSQASEIIAGRAPTGLRNGGFVGYSRVELFGEEINLVAPLYLGDSIRLEGLAGARFLQMRDRVDLTATGTSLPAKQPLFGLEDHFRTENAYYGGQVGLRGEATSGPWSLRLCGEIGLGGNDEQVRAFGDRIYQTPTVRTETQTGLFVQGSNRGSFERASLNLVSEVGVNVGYRMTRHAQVYGGYTFLLWDGPARAGDQIDLVINPNQGTAPARPAIPFKEDLFWAQGLNAGLEFSW